MQIIIPPSTSKAPRPPCVRPKAPGWPLHSTRLALAAPLLALLAQTSVLIPTALAQPGSGFGFGAATDTDRRPTGVSAFKALSLDDLMNLDVTSVSRQPEAYKNAPASLTVITQDEIRRSGASSLPEALRLADNLEVAQTYSSTWGISARGFNIGVGNKLLVLMDGRSLYSPLFSGVIWNMQDYLLEDIDRIEVISGPGGTLWGANAVNGVINIVTRSSRDTQGFYAEVAGGTGLQDAVGFRYGGAISSNVFFRVYGKYFDRGAEDYPDGSNAHDGWNRGQAGFRIDSYASPDNLLTLEGDGFGGFNDVVPGGQGTARFTGHTAGGHALGRWTHSFTDASDMSLQLYYDRVDLDAPFQGAGAIPQGDLIDHLDTYDLDFQDRFPLGERNHVVWGLEYRYTHDVVRSAPLVAFLPSVLDHNLYSAFLQDEITLLEPLTLTIGTKIEHHDYTGLEYEPSARLRWNLTEKQMVWGAVSRAVRTPARYDRDLYQPAPQYGALLIGNNTFDSETVLAYELGYRTEMGERAAASLSLFYNDYTKLRSINLTSNSLPLFYGNNNKAQSYGVELSGDYQLTEWWRLHAGYDWLHEIVEVGHGGDFANGLNEVSDPQNQVFVRSSITLPRGVEFDTSFRWIDRVRNNAGSTPGFVPSYAELDLRLAWHVTQNIELSIVGQNLVHERHVESGFPSSTQEAIARAVYGKIAWRW